MTLTSPFVDVVVFALLISSCLLPHLVEPLRLPPILPVSRARLKSYLYMQHPTSGVRVIRTPPKESPFVSRAVAAGRLKDLHQPSIQNDVQSKDGCLIANNANELRHLVLDQGLELRQVDLSLKAANYTASQLTSHAVIALIAHRFHTRSTPGNRSPDDKHRLALCLEGGGMRGAVSAGMATAIACLGLTDCFDAIYGSSAGSVIGAYMVSRQMCMDVYVDILPTAKRTFVCIKRMCTALAVNAVDLLLSQLPQLFVVPKFSTNAMPGMNISFVLDGVMDDTRGIRPLDLDRFQLNDRKQPLRVVSSFVDKSGRLRTKCFGSDDFFPCREHSNSSSRADDAREGIYACLEASMTVPGATGPPVPILDPNTNETGRYFDAFCFEPLPYRSAVEEGATHVLVLCSRPEGFQPTVKPGFYERAVAPIYFRSHNQPQVARFFEAGGQQYIYAEDLLTLEEGKRSFEKPVLVPPPQVLYGTTLDAATSSLVTERGKWNKAHVLPLKVPIGTPELPTLEQERSTVIEAVRGGFASAYDLLAHAIGLELRGFTGIEVAELIFPENGVDENVLDKQIRVIGDSIAEFGSGSPLPRVKPGRRLSFLRFLRSVLSRRRWARSKHLRIADPPGAKAEPSAFQMLDRNDDGASLLLSALPGLKEGKMAHLAQSLRMRQFVVSRNITAGTG